MAMTTPTPRAGRRSRRDAIRILPTALLLAASAMMTGCAASPRVELPADLPLQTNDQLFAFEWALQREPTVVRAVGRVRPSFNSEFWLTLGLFGVDADGRILSRGTAYVRTDFASRATPFAVELTPAGGETRFELRALEYHFPGLRMN
jgi:hypothetical protein